jgi:hypothetical protein
LTPKFVPKLAISLKGGTKRTRHPALKAGVTYPKGNYADVQVTLPHSAFLDTTHIGTICTRVQFAADTCPQGLDLRLRQSDHAAARQTGRRPIYFTAQNGKLFDATPLIANDCKCKKGKKKHKTSRQR